MKERELLNFFTLYLARRKKKEKSDLANVFSWLAHSIVSRKEINCKFLFWMRLNYSRNYRNQQGNSRKVSTVGVQMRTSWLVQFNLQNWSNRLNCNWFLNRSHQMIFEFSGEKSFLRNAGQFVHLFLSLLKDTALSTESKNSPVFTKIIPLSWNRV